MNFEPRIILGPRFGNNADARTVSVRVMNDTAATPDQMADLAGKFEMHMLQVNICPVGFMVHEGVLSDGSVYRVVSNSGVHTVMLWPAGGTPPSRFALPHGFAVVTNWRNTFIYKYRSDGTWAIAPDTVPQLPKGVDVQGYNQVAHLDVPLVLPGVHVDNKPKLWDFGPHAAARRGATVYSIPANLFFPDSHGNPKFEPVATHVLKDYSVATVGGTTLYQMTAPAALLVTPEPITVLPGCTDATGTTAALQLLRKALISQTADTWTYRFCNEAITRTGEQLYAASARNVVDVHLPVNGTSTASDVETLNASGMTQSKPLFVDALNSGSATTSVYLPPFNSSGVSTSGQFTLGMALASRTYTALTPTTSETTYKRVYSRGGADVVTIDKLIALPAVDAVEYPLLKVDLSYPATMNLAGGSKSWSGSFSVPGGARDFSREQLKSTHVDVQHNVDGAPDIQLDLPWYTIHLLEGTTTGRLYGTHWEDVETIYKRGGDVPQYSYAVAGPTPGGIGYTDAQIYDAWQAAAPNYAPSYAGDWSAWPCPNPPLAPGGVAAATNTTVVQDAAASCTGSYLLKNRHIIDYDHRSRFLAAIRVEVQCDGARWDQNPTGYKGELLSTANPTYQVHIYFECRWGTVSSEVLLASGTCTRPPFEFPRHRVQNVYVYPSDDTLKPLYYWMPPELNVPKEVMSNLVNLSLHQGVNPHQVARMFFPAVPDGVVSPEGIEYTNVTIDANANVNATLQKRFVDGQLYARSFKLSDADIQDVQWMLHALCVDAPQNNGYPTDGTQPAMWFYMPDLGTIVQNTTFHVEVRNGVIEQWSDNIPADGDHPLGQPAANQRTIALYEV